MLLNVVAASAFNVISVWSSVIVPRAVWSPTPAVTSTSTLSIACPEAAVAANVCPSIVKEPVASGPELTAIATVTESRFAAAVEVTVKVRPSSANWPVADVGIALVIWALVAAAEMSTATSIEPDAPRLALLICRSEMVP